MAAHKDVYLWDAVELQCAQADRAAAGPIGYRDGWHLAHTIILATHGTDASVVRSLNHHAAMLRGLADRLPTEHAARPRLVAQVRALRDAAELVREASR